MNDMVCKIEDGNKRLEIWPDIDCPSPREWDNLGTIVGYHRKYNLCDEEAENTEDYKDWDDWFYNEVVKPAGGWNQVVYYPVFMYDHGMVTLSIRSFSCPWDSGQLGFIYVTKEKIREWFGVKRVSKQLLDQVRGYLRGEMETYDQWGTGDCYGFTLEEVSHCKECGSELTELVDSCGGFFGWDDCLEYMKYYVGLEEYDYLFDMAKEKGWAA